MQIAVTQDHIDQGVRRKTAFCPVALAIKAAYSQLDFSVLVGYHTLTLVYPNACIDLDIDNDLRQWIQYFDWEQPNQPITVDLDFQKQTATIARKKG